MTWKPSLESEAVGALRCHSMQETYGWCRGVYVLVHVLQRSNSDMNWEGLCVNHMYLLLSDKGRGLIFIRCYP